MIRVLIVDDEPVAREGTRALLRQEPDVEIVGECADGAAAVRAIEQSAPDIILLDIQMPRINGFDVLRAFDDARRPVVIFLTAHGRHALHAFDARALDYVLKPFTDARFRTAMARAREVVHQRRAAAERSVAAPGNPSPYLERLTARSVGRTNYVRTEDIAWIRSSDYYAEVHTVQGNRILVRETMQKLERCLDPLVFRRTHRSAIVRLDFVAGLRRRSVVLREGTVLPVGRAQRRALEAALDGR